LDLKSKHGKCASHVEQTVNAYYRLHKDRLQKEIDDDFAANGSSESRLAHRNRYLSRRYKEEPEDVKEFVKNCRLKTVDRTIQDVKWTDGKEITDDEKNRRDGALEYSALVTHLRRV
jgi:hypothetical protein